MAPGSARPRTSKLAQAVQDSKLLNLPPELRNLVYEFVASSTHAISVRENKVLYCPALSLTCRQIRTEYKRIYAEESPKYASRVHVHLTNFVTRISTYGPVSRILETLPDPVSLERSWTVQILMTNFWDRHRQDLRNFIENGKILHSKFDLEIVWDPKTFDEEFLRETMQKLRFCHARTGRLRECIWPQVENALTEAFERYAKPVKPTPRRRKRRRTTAKVDEPPRKSRRRC